MQPLTPQQRLVLLLALAGVAVACLPLGYWWFKGADWRMRDELPAPLFCLGLGTLVVAFVVHRVLKIKQ